MTASVTPRGRFWVGTMDLDEAEPIGDLYCVEKGGSHRAMGFAVTVSNGMAWDRACRRMFYIDSPTREVREFPFDAETGRLGDPRIVRRFDEYHGYPDGMTIDAEDKLWVAFWDGAAVRRIDPQTGEILGEIEVPAKRPTSCSFGGDDLRDLYITSASVDLGSNDLGSYPMSGKLMTMRTEVEGFPAFALGG